jgi:hypothetical protein
MSVTLHVIDGDLLDATTEAITLPIDGELPPTAGTTLIDRSLGRIARAFVRRYPDCELVDEIDSQVTFPLALGSAAELELPTGSPFRVAVLLSILPHHPDQTSAEQLKSGVSRALTAALALCEQLSLTSVAVPVLKGGWRLPEATAISTMLQAFSSAIIRHPLTVEIRVLDEPELSRNLRDLARSFGL